jgi:multidrug efflux pump subunit AcrA (membrane-fusion protein)
MSIQQLNEISICQFINSLIKRLSLSAPILLAGVVLAAGCAGRAAVPPPPNPPPATALVLTAEQNYDVLTAVALRGGCLA